MKRTLIILILLSNLTFLSHGQSFPDSAARWTYYQSDLFQTLRFTQYNQEPDTIINDKTYNKLLYSMEMKNSYYDTIINSLYNEYIGAILSDNNQKKVFLIPKDSINEVLLYDFDMEVGDTVPIWHNKFNHTITVERIDTILIGSKSLRRFEIITNLTDSSVNEHAIIEGIGSVREFLNIENYLEGYYSFTCFKDFKTNFSYPEHCNYFLLSSGQELRDPSFIDLSINPNPCTDHFFITFPDISSLNNTKAVIIDIHGRTVEELELNMDYQYVGTSYFENGLYFLNIYNENQLLSTRKFIIKK